MYQCTTDQGRPDEHDALSALLIYEHSLTLSDELDLLWRRERSAASVIFALNRVASIAVVVGVVSKSLDHVSQGYLSDWLDITYRCTRRKLSPAKLSSPSRKLTPQMLQVSLRERSRCYVRSHTICGDRPCVFARPEVVAILTQDQFSLGFVCMLSAIRENCWRQLLPFLVWWHPFSMG